MDLKKKKYRANGYKKKHMDKLGQWITNFLLRRKCCVKFNSNVSDLFNIETPLIQDQSLKLTLYGEKITFGHKHKYLYVEP